MKESTNLPSLENEYRILDAVRTVWQKFMLLFNFYKKIKPELCKGSHLPVGILGQLETLLNIIERTSIKSYHLSLRPEMSEEEMEKQPL